jgi:hypothetical protein
VATTYPEHRSQARRKYNDAAANLLCGKSIISDIGEVASRRRVDFFVLAGDEHAGDSEKLQYFAIDTDLPHECIQEIDGEKKRLWTQAVLVRYLDQPVDKNGSHIVRNIAARTLEIIATLVMS